MKQSMILVFVDGLGLGELNPASNPLTADGLHLLANFSEPGWLPPEGGGRPESLPRVHRLSSLPSGVRVTATDASLGVAGLPQSATGQTTLFTGLNGAEALGGNHYTGFPTFTLKKLIKKQSLLKTIRERGKEPVFLNAFSPRFFEAGEAVWEEGFLSASTWATRAAGIPLRNFEDLKESRAIFHDITHDTMGSGKWIRPTEVQALRTPREAGRILAEAADRYDFVLFEFFLTDKVGHRRDRPAAVHELLKLEAFLEGALDHLDGARHTLLWTSDHGNVEDLSTKTHTINPVFTISYGLHAGSLAPRLTALEGFAPGILETLFPETS